MRKKKKKTLFQKLEEVIKRNPALFRILKSDVKFKIVSFIYENPETIQSNIVEVNTLNQSSIARHLKELENSKIIEKDKRGIFNHYFLNKSFLDLVKKIVD